MPLNGNILITGGSGTLGRAILRTAQRERWDASFTVFSRSELLQAQMRADFPAARYVLGDVRDYDRLSAAVAGHDLVVHAAALKRVPEAEEQPTECYQTNVAGSINVVRACIAAGVKKCIGISTDKACRAVTAYGASKLAMEKVFLSQPTHLRLGLPSKLTAFSCVRYGNVVGSRGSVIPLWRKQAAVGEPLTVTRADATRFWMAPSQAVKVIEDAATCAGGLVLVPKMSSLGIGEMAHILFPGAALKEVGFRSLEKVHEDLVADDEVATDGHEGAWPGGSIYSQSIYYWLGGISQGKTGHSYTSDRAERLAPDAFLKMLNEAESYS